MHTFRHISLMALIGLLSISIPVTAKAMSHAKKAAAPKGDSNYNFIKQAYDYQNSGYAAMDVNIIMSYTSSDYMMGDIRGAAMTKNMVINELYDIFKELAQSHVTVQRKITIQKMDISQNKALVIETSHSWVTAPAGGDPTGVPNQVSGGDGTYRDIWVRTTSGWAEESSVRLGAGG